MWFESSRWTFVSLFEESLSEESRPEGWRGWGTNTWSLSTWIQICLKQTLELLNCERLKILLFVGLNWVSITCNQKSTLIHMFCGHDSGNTNTEKSANTVLPSYTCVMKSLSHGVSSQFLCIIIHINSKSQSSWGRRELRVSQFKVDKLGNLECFHEKSGTLLLSSASECESPCLYLQPRFDQTK